MTTFTVTTTADVVDENDGELSLREAIAAANNAAGADMIIFNEDAQGLIRLDFDNDELVIEDELVIDGGGKVTITGDASDNDTTSGDITNVELTPFQYKSDNSQIIRVIDDVASVTLDGLTLTGGRTSAEFDVGGAVTAGANVSLTIANSTIRGNETAGSIARGGAVYSKGDLTITNSVVSNNKTNGANADGGAIFADGALTIDQSTIEGNRTVGTDADGGGIAASGALTITDSVVSGNRTDGYTASGGGIYASVTATITRSVISDNTSSGKFADGGGVSTNGVLTVTGAAITGNVTAGDYADGGGLFSNAALNIYNSTISGNQTTGRRADGAGAASEAALSITNSTVANNETQGDISVGAGVFADDTLTISSSTITGNTTARLFTVGTGAQANGAVTVENSIILGNNTAGDGSSTEVKENGFGTTEDGLIAVAGVNIIGESSSTFNTMTNVAGGSTGSVTNQLATDIFAATVQDNGVAAGVLADNGGPVQTVALDGSVSNPALGASGAGAPNADSRGIESVSGRDLGAYQTPAAQNLIVTTLDAEVNPDDGETSLREAVIAANNLSGANTITFDAGLSGVIRLTKGELTVTEALTINGDGRITISGDRQGDDTLTAEGFTDVFASTAAQLDDNSRVINASAALTLDGLVVTGGSVGGIFKNGGGVSTSNGADLTVQNSLIAGNTLTAGVSGGGGLSADGALLIENSTITQNSSTGTLSKGGGVYSRGALTITNSTITDNAANLTGGGAATFDTLTVTSSTVTGNYAIIDGSNGGGLQFTGAAATIRDSIILGNAATPADNDGNSGPEIQITDAGVNITFEGANIVGDSAAAFDTTDRVDPGSTGTVQNASAADVFAATEDNNGVAAGVLADNGGPLQTVALKADKTNAAIDAAATAGVDARGKARNVDFSGVDNGGASDLGAYEVQLDEDIVRPSFTTGSVIGIAENTTAVATIAAFDNLSNPTLSITGGSDAALFTLNAATGALSFVSAPDFETPGDSNGNNNYQVEITAQDQAGNTAARTFSVSVSDVDETPPVDPTPVDPTPVDPTPTDPTPVDPTGGDQPDDGDAGGGGATAGDDILTGTPGPDAIQGLGGSDQITGLGGADTLEGNGGADTLIGNGGRDQLTGGGGKDDLRGGGGKDLLIGNGGKDVLNGGGGKDDLNGGGGKDTLDGGGGKDVVDGGGGKDELTGGRGADELTGGRGRDTFQFQTRDGRDTITDFEQGRDKIEILQGAESFDDLRINQAGDNVLIAFSNVRVTVLDDDAGAFAANDFIF